MTRLSSSAAGTYAQIPDAQGLSGTSPKQREVCVPAQSPLLKYRDCVEIACQLYLLKESAT